MPPTGADHAWLLRAIELAGHCPPSSEAYSVGAVLVDADGRELATGHSRDTDPTVHAEESALATVGRSGHHLSGATLYSSLEPCTRRRSRPRSCTELIVASGVRRVVLSWREPDLFVSDCRGVELLTGAGIEVVELPEHAPAAMAVNRHLRLSE